jgi:2-keto-3-deoxy-L-rhamnonate aldolase RhmA
VLRNRLRELIDEKPSALGTFITIGDPVAVELAGLAGFEFVAAATAHHPGRRWHRR